jgi:hypothetical protein
MLALDSQTVFVTEGGFFRKLSEFTEYFRSPEATVKIRDEPERQLYYTRTGRLILPEIDPEESFAFNFLVGDTVQTPSGVKARFVGCQDGVVWIRPLESRCVFSVLDSRSLVCRARPGNEIYHVTIDGEPAILDRTPSFCEQFGRSVGDLIWFPRRGIVEVVGLYSNKFVFLDFSDNALFSSDPYHFMLVRAKNKKLSYHRTILTAEGETVILNVCGQNAIFQPADRIVGEYGGGTFLGSDGKRSFVQFDEMRVHEIDGCQVDIAKIELTRRIGMKTVRDITVDGRRLSVSISARDRVADLIPDDIIRCGVDLHRVVGIGTEEGKVFARPLGGGEVIDVANPANVELVYRADILSGKRSEAGEVGSPAFEVATLVPNDLVEIDGRRKVIFKGIGRSGPTFLDPDTNELFSTSFSALVMPESFVVLERTLFTPAVQVDG